MTTNFIHLYSDGSTAPKHPGGNANPGVGGWGAVLILNETVKASYGTLPLATNNYMETYAVLQGLEQIKKPSRVHVFSDSSYVVRGVRKLLSKRMFSTHPELWAELAKEVRRHNVSVSHVAGHSTFFYNELTDRLAKLGSFYKQEGHFYVGAVEAGSAEDKLLQTVKRCIEARKRTAEARPKKIPKRKR